MAVASPARKKKAAPARRSTPAVDPEKRDLVKQVVAAYKKCGKDPYETAAWLNKNKVRTLLGLKFTPRSVTNYVR